MWAKVRQSFIKYGGFSTEDADLQRHQIHRDALGRDKSAADLTNRDLDAILDHFRAVLTITDGPAAGPTRAAEMPRRRLIWAIEKTGLGDAYLNAIVADACPPGSYPEQWNVAALAERVGETLGLELPLDAWTTEDGLEPDDYAESDPVNQEYVAYYREMGMSADKAKAFYDLTNSVPHDEALYLKPSEIASCIPLN